MADEEFSRGLECALRFLKSRERFEAEVREHLASKCFDRDVGERVLEHLRAKHVLDEGRAAEAYVRRAQGKGIGRIRVEQELLAHGAPVALIAAVCGQSSESERSRAAALLAKKQPKDGAAAARYLAGKGFDEEVVASLVEELYKDDPADGSDCDSG